MTHDYLLRKKNTSSLLLCKSQSYDFSLLKFLLSNMFSLSLSYNHLMSKNNKKKKISDLKNGGILLEELIGSFGGKTNPIRCFSSDQILKATDNFSESGVISSWGYFIWYRGLIEDRPVSIKKWSDQNISSFTEAYRDISVSSQMSGHKNDLKLLGCCLEFDLPALISEYTEHGPLNRDGGISSGQVLPWKVRLNVDKEIWNDLAGDDLVLRRSQEINFEILRRRRRWKRSIDIVRV